ncbi:MAG: ABC transporter permease [candidate division Zixibacteria bacterium]|jgi:putative ABC transport system permease protein|nr:ABC transporter permease [candidate division Zixibacteria bacterium]
MGYLYRLVKAAIRSIGKNRMRSLLTSLGIIIGVSAVIIMVAIGEGSSSRITASIDSLGTNLIMIIPGTMTTGGARMGAGTSERFTFDDVDHIRKNCEQVARVSPVVRTADQVVGGGNNWYTTIYGVDPDYLAIRNWEIDYGEPFDDKDVTARRKVAVIGSTVARELFGETDAVGQTIRIRNIPFTVVGVLKSKGQNAMGQDQDDTILAPSTSVLYRLKGRQWIDMINAGAISTEQVSAAIEELRALMRAAHGLQDGQEDDFTIRSQAEIMEMVNETTKTMTLLLGSIAAVSLLVGGIGIMNIMLVSVTERTREIGIRLSVGARESDILVQFLTEAVVLSVSGGLVGIALSIAIVGGLNRWTELDAIVTPEIVALSFLFSAAVGIFFGFYPARKAALLDPIDALRHE